MAGLDPAIHADVWPASADARIASGHDEDGRFPRPQPIDPTT
jgi:hypothetical protein